MLKSINLALASICGAKCIFCASDIGKNIKGKIMDYDIAKKIIDEISSDSFSQKHDIQRIELGEEGDAFLNKDFLKIARYIKQKLPNVTVEIFTNFQNFSEELAFAVLNEQLVNNFRCNIDGSNLKNYYNVKKLNLELVLKNLKNFIKIRESLNSNAELIIYVITLNNYIHTIKEKLGFYPKNLEDLKLIKIPDDFIKTEKLLKKIIVQGKDKVCVGGVMGWAEREGVDITKIVYNEWVCPNLNRLETEAFFAPDGSWFACCYDSRNDLILGNIKDQSIDDIFNSYKRMDMIEKLRMQKFQEIGGPCLTVNACHYYGQEYTPNLVRRIKNRILVVYNKFFNLFFEGLLLAKK